MIDSETPHVSTIYYNFGKISSEETEYNVTPEADFCIPVETYKTVFACPLDDSVQKFDWIEAPTGCKLEGAAYVLTYSKINEITWGDTQVAQIYTTPSADAEASNANLLDYLVATNGVSNKEYGGSLKELLNGKARYMSTDITATLTSDDTKKADFYDVAVTSAGFTFTPKGSNPKDNVPSTLTIKLKDAFGHTHVIAVPFTVKKN